MVGQPQYLYKICPVRVGMLTDGPTPEEENAIAAHFGYLEQLIERGILILAGRTLNKDDQSFGLIIFKAAGEDAARKIMSADPAVRMGIMSATLYPFRVALMQGLGEKK